MHRLQRKSWLSIEFFLLMVVLPVVLYFYLPIKFLLLVIWGLALLCHLGAHAVSLPPRVWWLSEAVTWKNLKPIFARFMLSALVLGAMVALYQPHLLFNFVKRTPAFWALVMVLYPLLSVIPQEIIFRRFFFTRYGTLFTRPWVMIFASAVAFAWAHILFHNWIAPVLCLIGGLFFARTYQRHRSLMLVSIEHALYGDLIFTLGLGQYFFHGAVQAAVQAT